MNTRNLGMVASVALLSLGFTGDAPSVSWNSSHPSRGCSLDNLKASGGAGMIYCFAAK